MTILLAGVAVLVLASPTYAQSRAQEGLLKRNPHRKEEISRVELPTEMLGQWCDELGTGEVTTSIRGQCPSDGADRMMNVHHDRIEFHEGGCKSDKISRPPKKGLQIYKVEGTCSSEDVTWKATMGFWYAGDGKLYSQIIEKGKSKAKGGDLQ